MMTVYKAGAALGVVLLVAACGGGGNGGGTGPCQPGPATQLLKTTGDPAPWYVNNPLPGALSVTVKDANNCAVPAVTVSWSITTGGGGLSAAQSTTNSSGIATITDSLGGASTQVVQATSAGLPTQTFPVQALQAPTTVGIDVRNDFFSPADTALQAARTATWTWNSGGTTHTLTFTDGPAPLPAETVQSNGTKVITFNSVGKYSYHCTIHTGMNGTLTIVH